MLLKIIGKLVRISVSARKSTLPAPWGATLNATLLAMTWLAMAETVRTKRLMNCIVLCWLWFSKVAWMLLFCSKQKAFYTSRGWKNKI